MRVCEAVEVFIADGKSRHLAGPSRGRQPAPFMGTPVFVPLPGLSRRPYAPKQRRTPTPGISSGQVRE